jgi:hypothetical protein
MSESVIFALIKMSSKKDGNGAIIAKTMPRTAIGTVNWRQLAAKPAGADAPAAACEAEREGGLAATRTFGVNGSLLLSSDGPFLARLPLAWMH